MPSELNVNKISPASGTEVSLGDSGDTITITSGVTLAGDGSGLTSLPAANLTGTIHADRYTDTVYTHPTTAGNKHIPTAGATDQVLTYSSSGTASWADPAGGGKVQQIVYTLDGDDANGTGTIPFDNTIPQQSSEGTEFMTRAITATSSSSVLRIDVITSLSHSVSDMCIQTALFKDSIENALAVSWMHATYGNNHNIMTCLTHHIVAGSTSSQTFKVRCGGSSGTTHFNSRVSSPTGQMFGAITQSSITITEYTP
jgi:hypothetical protein